MDQPVQPLHFRNLRDFFCDKWRKIHAAVKMVIYMENHHVFMGKSTISMAIFNCYFDITRGYILLDMYLVANYPRIVFVG